MYRTLFSIGALALAASALAGSPIQKKAASPVQRIAMAKQENQFVTVDEFTHAGRGPRTVVSIEGYAVVGFRLGDGSVRISLVDSVDHVLNPKDANQFAAGGAWATLPASAVKSRSGWGWSPKGLLRMVMYTGSGQAQRALHDIVPKLRVTGWTSSRNAVSPVAKVEFQNDNGDWKPLP